MVEQALERRSDLVGSTQSLILRCKALSRRSLWPIQSSNKYCSTLALWTWLRKKQASLWTEQLKSTPHAILKYCQEQLPALIPLSSACSPAGRSSKIMSYSVSLEEPSPSGCGRCSRSYRICCQKSVWDGCYPILDTNFDKSAELRSFMATNRLTYTANEVSICQKES